MIESCMRRTHVIQRNLRPPGGKGYAIPHGFGFDHITCANYTAEIYGWILFAAATWTLPALIFITAGAAQMAIWAKAKHARLRKVITCPVLPHTLASRCFDLHLHTELTPVFPCFGPSSGCLCKVTLTVLEASYILQLHWHELKIYSVMGSPVVCHCRFH